MGDEPRFVVAGVGDGAGDGEHPAWTRQRIGSQGRGLEVGLEVRVGSPQARPKEFAPAESRAGRETPSKLHTCFW